MGVEMGYIRLHSSVFKSFMPKGEGRLSVDIIVRLKVQLLWRMTRSERKSLKELPCNLGQLLSKCGSRPAPSPVNCDNCKFLDPTQNQKRWGYGPSCFNKHFWWFKCTGLTTTAVVVCCSLRLDISLNRHHNN